MRFVGAEELIDYCGTFGDCRMKSSRACLRLENVLGYRLMLPGAGFFRQPWQYTSPAARQWPRRVALSLAVGSEPNDERHRR